MSSNLQENSKKLILIQHAWLDSADSVFFAGKKSIGIHLVDLGFDVWVGNNRGNKYSRRSSPDFMNNGHGQYEKFFDYSFQEMGIYDQTAVYKYLAKLYSEKPQLEVTFIGNSQGTAQMFAGLSDDESSEFLSKHTKRFIAVAPVVFLNHSPSYALQAVGKAISQNSPLIEKNNSMLGMIEFARSPCVTQKNTFIKNLAHMFCHIDHSLTNWICGNIVPGMPMNLKINDLMDDMDKLLNHYPSGSSIKTLLHFGQMINIPKEKFIFPKYDYGKEQNLVKYGQEGVPVWDLSKINVEVALITGTEDMLANKVDVSELFKRLPSDKTTLHWIDGWDHYTNIFPRDPKPFFEVIDKLVL